METYEKTLAHKEMDDRTKTFAWLLSSLHTEFSAKADELYQEYRYSKADEVFEFHRQEQAIGFKNNCIDFIMDYLERSMPDAENRSHGVRDFFNSHKEDFRTKFNEAFNNTVIPVRKRKNPAKKLSLSFVFALISGISVIGCAEGNPPMILPFLSVFAVSFLCFLWYAIKPSPVGAARAACKSACENIFNCISEMVDSEMQTSQQPK